MAGTVVLSSQRAEGVIRWARILATADSSAATIPATTLRSLGVSIDGTIIGVLTNPGSTAPTDNYDITLIDADGADRFGGALADRDTANTEYAVVGRAAAPDETLTLTFANNAVNSATVELVIYWTNGASAGGGGSSSSVSITGTVTTSDTTAQGKLDTIIGLLGTSVASQVWKSYANTSATLTGQAIWTPGGGKKIAITHLTIGTRATTAGLLTLWFGAGADTTYTANTDQAVYIGSFAPSSGGYPGVVLAPPTPIICTNADYVLRATTSANLDFDLVVYGYEF